MKSVDAHLDDILSEIEPLRPMNMQLLDAHGCLLVEDVVSDRELPPWDNSAMDGYAVRLADVEGATAEFPAVLPVADDIAAGSVGTHRIVPGVCSRIMTGAPVPPGAEAIVPVEWTDAGIATVRISQAPKPGQHIRRRGDDIELGERLLEADTWLAAPQIALLAAMGRDRVRVRPRPRVVVFATGDELVEPGAAVGPGKIYESNSYALTAAAREAGAIGYRVGIVRDDPQALLDTIEDQLVRADVVVTSGGVSAGAYDVVKEVLSRLGTVGFDSLAMQPGKPQGFGWVGPDQTPIFTLPGNPVSAYVSFEVFVRPALRRMMGLADVHRPIVKATCVDAFKSPEAKRQYARGWYDRSGGEAIVRPVGGAGSHLVGDLAQSNAFIVVPEAVTDVNKGDTVDVMVLERRLP
jgi:molybdopterin molybdotransferase